MEHPCAEARRLTPQEHRREKVRKVIGAVKWQAYLLYLRTLYRPHMRIIHHFGWHWHKARSIDGIKRCDWCGDMKK